MARVGVVLDPPGDRRVGRVGGVGQRIVSSPSLNNTDTDFGAEWGSMLVPGKAVGCVASVRRLWRCLG